MRKKGHKFIITPAVVRESLDKGADNLLSLIQNGLIIEKSTPVISKTNPSLMKHLCFTFGSGEIETMILSKALNDAGNHVFPIIDENAAHDYWVNDLGKGIGIYRTGRFIIEASKQWGILQKGKAAEYISKLSHYDYKAKKLLLGKLKIPENEVDRIIRSHNK